MSTEANEEQQAVEVFPDVDLSIPQMTMRSIITGMILGGVLSLCNIYTGLKIGWGFNMSVAAALLSFGFWQLLHKTTGSRSWNILENNVNQTAASAAASISSAGLVAPIPALTLLTGQKLTWAFLSVWVFSVAFLGVIVAIAMRQQMLVNEKLKFPYGIATAETLKEMYARGTEAMAKVRMLLAGAALAGGVKAINGWVVAIPKLLIPIGIATKATALKAAGITTVSMKNLGFLIDPSFLMIGGGMIMGMKAALSVLVGAVIAWLIMAPEIIDAGALPPDAIQHMVDKPDGVWFKPLVGWLLWPGVAMMVTASLTSFAFSWRSFLNAFRPSKRQESMSSSHPVPLRWFMGGLVVALVLSVVCQWSIFDIPIWIAVLAVFLSFLLAIVAARVAGETGIVPIGAMGKVTQFTFGAIAPGQASANLMTANVTGGSASQCADMLNDLKTGLMIGASPRYQALAQVFGVLAGALVGSAAYLLIFPDPQSMCFTEEWQAPAVAQWYGVAKLMSEGFEQLEIQYPGATQAMVIAGIVGIVLSVLDKTLPKRLAKWVPSGAGIGIAFCITGYYAVSMFVGALIALVWARKYPASHKRYCLVLAAGLIAGESLMGVVVAITKVL